MHMPDTVAKTLRVLSVRDQSRTLTELFRTGPLARPVFVTVRDGFFAIKREKGIW